MAALQNLEDGEAKKQSQMKWVDGANYGMLGADVGYGAYAAGTAATASRDTRVRWKHRCCAASP